MRLLILGASGQLGRICARGLADAGHDVTGTTRGRDPRLRTFDPFGADWAALGRFDFVVNTIGAIAETGGETFERVHVELARRILGAHAALGEPRVIQVSALGARADHRSRFLATKAVGDRRLREALGAHVLVLRPSIVCTGGTRLVQRLRRRAQIARFSRGVVPVPAGFSEARLQPVGEVDFVRAVREACTTFEPGVLEVAGAEKHRLRDLAALALSRYGLRLRAVAVRRSLLRKAHVLAPRGLIEREELELLGEDNVAAASSESGRSPWLGGDTQEFFRRELLGP